MLALYREKLKELIDDGRIYFGKEGNNVPRLNYICVKLNKV